MIKSPELLAALEKRQRSAVDQSRAYHDALGVFSALWQEARAVNADCSAALPRNFARNGCNSCSLAGKPRAFMEVREHVDVLSGRDRAASQGPIA